MNTIPFFSILVPTYNQAQYLGEALDSLISQTDSDWEAIIVNDGSTDSTTNVLEQYAEKENRFRVFHKKNGGVGSALNLALKEAKGQWICWLSSDDLFEPQKLEIHKNWIKNFSQYQFFFSNFRQLNESTKELIVLDDDLSSRIPKKEWQVIELFKANYIAGNSICINKKSWLKVGYFNESLKYAQDYDMWLRLISHYPAIFIPEKTCIQRIHPAQDSNKFFEACLFDSAKSSIDFLTQHTYSDLFPLVDLKSYESSQEALFRCLDLASTFKAHFYQLGYHPFLLMLIYQWLENNCSQEYQQGFKQIITDYTQEIIESYHNLPIRYWWKFAELVYQLEPDFALKLRGNDNSKVIRVIAKIHYFWIRLLNFDKAEPLKKYLEKFENLLLEVPDNKILDSLLSELETFASLTQISQDFLMIDQLKADFYNLHLIDRLLIMDQMEFSLSEIHQKSIVNGGKFLGNFLFFLILFFRLKRFILSGTLMARTKGYLQFISNK